MLKTLLLILKILCTPRIAQTGVTINKEIKNVAILNALLNTSNEVTNIFCCTLFLIPNMIQRKYIAAIAHVIKLPK